jgi:hypothetical protein
VISIKKKHITFISSGLIVLAVVLLYNMYCQNVNVNFTEKITFKYDYFEKKINVQITDENDKSLLVSMCKGMAISDSPSCGFGSAEIIFEGKNKKISIYPACDGCDLMRVNDTEKYFSIGKENRKKLVEILEKYGAKFPCI